MNFRHTRRLLLLFACLNGVALALSGQAGPPASEDAPNREIERLLSTPGVQVDGIEILAQQQLLEAYHANEFRPFWSTRSRVEELLSLINSAPEHGLDPVDYGQREIERLLIDPPGEPDATLQAQRDILLSESLYRYAYHRRFGKIKASTLDPDINYRRDSLFDQTDGKTLQQALTASSLETFIDMAAPAGPVYRALQKWLAHYRQIAAAGGWPSIPGGPALRLDDQGPRVTAIRARLVVSGELQMDNDLPHDSATDAFDVTLQEAVQRFQRHHGLAPDGVVGKQTLTELNVTVNQRIDQLRLSLERLRWVNQEASDTLIAVNIAGFRAFYVRDGVPVWETRAMVGRTYRQTPTFRSDLAYIELNPSWTIPPVILNNDILPTIKRDPDYLARNNIVVLDFNNRPVDPHTIDWNQFRSNVPFLLRQEPGPANALGSIKFIFPNPHAVFLHDTPHRELFERPERAFSSGCIRIENPLKLAALLLEDAATPPLPDLDAIVRSGETRRIHLNERVPVIIVYLTASIDDDGSVLFYRDIYARDARALEALNGPVVLELPPSV